MPSVESLEFVGKFSLCMALATTAHLLGTAAAGALLGARLEKVRLFFGRPLVTLTLNGVELQVGFVPLGGSVQFQGMGPDSQSDLERVPYRSLPLAKRLLISVSGPVLLLLLGCLLLGVAGAGASLSRGFAQPFLGAAAPLSTGQALLQSLWLLLSQKSISLAVGVVLVKAAAFNLLPLPALNGGAFLLELLGSRLSAGQIQKIQTIGLLPVMLLFVGWIAAFTVFLWGLVFS
ncbi:MAG: site-2 protease family protein [Cytophagales bacterium]|nr:site-2 protease family protein [Armatimonadota bacterium]